MPFKANVDKPVWIDKGINSKDTQVIDLKVAYSGLSTAANIIVTSTDGTFKQTIPLSTIGDSDKRSVEVMFSLDTSGSMSNIIIGVVASLGKFMTDIRASIPANVITRFGIHIHSDTGKGEHFLFGNVVSPGSRSAALVGTTVSRPVHQDSPGAGYPTSDAMTTNSANVAQCMTNWATAWLQGGGDPDESQREALDSIAYYAPYVFSPGSYRGITRYCILVTDAYSHYRTGIRWNPFRDTRPDNSGGNMVAADGPLGAALAASRVKLFIRGGGYTGLVQSVQAGFAPLPESTGYASLSLNSVIVSSTASILTAILADLEGKTASPSVVVPDNKTYKCRLHTKDETGATLEDVTKTVVVGDRTPPVINKLYMSKGVYVKPFLESKLFTTETIINADGTIIKGTI